MSGLIQNKWVNPVSMLGRDVADPLRLFPKEQAPQPPAQQRKPQQDRRKPVMLGDANGGNGL